MNAAETDPVKQQVAAHWGRRAAHFDEDFGHTVRTTAERAAWDRIFDLVLAGRGALDTLDAGCGTGFLSLELASRGHRVTGVDFAPEMLAEARRKAAEKGAAVRFEEADAEQLPFASGRFDLVVSRHVLWTLPHPEAAIDEWIRVLRPGGRLAVIDGQFDPGEGDLPGWGGGAHVSGRAGNGPVREFSLWNDPAERARYCIAVLREAEGQGSREWHERVRVGDIVEASAPRNNFSLAAGAMRHLLIAGGIGITPIMAMIAQLRRNR